MQIPPSKSQESLSAIGSLPNKKSSDSLAHKFKDILEELDRTVASSSKETVGYAQQLEDIFIRLRVWAEDLNIQQPNGQEEFYPGHVLTTLDCLNILDASYPAAATALHKTLDEIAKRTTNVSRILNGASARTNKAHASVDQELETAVSSLWRLTDHLDGQKVNIQKNIASATAEDVHRTLWEGDGQFARASVLTIDGGGVRSYSSILIIRALMDQIRSLSRKGNDKQEHSLDQLKPGGLFEYIIGSSSGGLIAIMLGRLKMTEDKCLETFQDYAAEIFGHPQWRLRTFGGLLSPKYNSNRLLRAVRAIARESDSSVEGERWKYSLFASPDESCKTAVIAYNCKDGENVPYILRTYDSSKSNRSNVDHIRNPGSAATCQIWEAARATSAAPKYFAPILIDENLFIDGGFGTNNPTFEAFNELTQSKRDVPLDPLIVSVGSGTSRRRSRLKTSRMKPLIVSNIYSAFDVATDTDRVHQEMSIIARERKFAYFRFSVDEGLEDILLDNWRVQKTDGKISLETISHIIAQTKNYLQRQDIQQELRSCAQLLVDRLKMKNPGPSPTRISSVPFNRDTDFVGRKHLLSRLHQGFSGLNRMALVGIGGVGKSQIAIEYSYRFQDYHSDSWVFWVHAGSRSRFRQSYREIADLVKIPGRDDTAVDVLQLVCEWLCRESTKTWLLILDNADDPSVFEDNHVEELGVESKARYSSSQSLYTFVPQTRDGFVLVTSRSMAVARRLTGDDKGLLTVEQMPREEACVLLQKKLVPKWDADDVAKLVQALDYIPLALTQAAAFINERAPRYTVRKYLEALEAGVAQAKLLYEDSGNSRRDYSAANSIGDTLHLSFDHIQRIAPSAARLLSLMSFFRSDRIQDYLLVHYNDNRAGGLGSEGEGKTEFERDVSLLRSYCLIRTNEQGNLFMMHKLVQRILKMWLKRNGDLEEIKTRFLMIMAKAFPEHPYEDDLTKCKELFPHAEAAIDYSPINMQQGEYYGTVIRNASLYAKATGSLDIAKNMINSALGCCQETLGHQHPLTISCTLELALILQKQGKYEPAEILIRSVNRKMKTISGPNHPDTLVSAVILASVLIQQGKLSESQSLSHDLLDLCQRTHPRMLSASSNLAAIRSLLDREERALDLQNTFLDQRRRSLGEDHPDTLSIMSNLAVTHQVLGYEEIALVLSKSVLYSGEGMLRTAHPEVVSAIADVAATIADRDRTFQLREIEGRILEKRPSRRSLP